jgi:hypothetical protein
MDRPPFADYAKIHMDTTERIFGIKLDFDEDSILKLDGLIQQSWPDEPPKMIDSVIILFGSFLGEAIKNTLGGEWAELDGQWFIRLSDAQINVFNKVKKRLLNGEEDSISYFYRMLKQMKEKKIRHR